MAVNSFSMAVKVGLELGYLRKYGKTGSRLMPGSKEELGIGTEFVNIFANKTRSKLNETQLDLESRGIIAKMFSRFSAEINERAQVVKDFLNKLPRDEVNRVSWEINQSDINAMFADALAGNKIGENLETLKNKLHYAEKAEERMAKQQREIEGGINTLIYEHKRYNVRDIVYSFNEAFRSGGEFVKKYTVLGAVSNLYVAGKNSADPYWNIFSELISELDPGLVFRAWQSAAEAVRGTGKKDLFEVVFEFSNAPVDDSGTKAMDAIDLLIDYVKKTTGQDLSDKYKSYVVALEATEDEDEQKEA